MHREAGGPGVSSGRNGRRIKDIRRRRFPRHGSHRRDACGTDGSHRRDACGTDGSHRRDACAPVSDAWRITIKPDPIRSTREASTLVAIGKPPPSPRFKKTRFAVGLRSPRRPACARRRRIGDGLVCATPVFVFASESAFIRSNPDRAAEAECGARSADFDICDLLFDGRPGESARAAIASRRPLSPSRPGFCLTNHEPRTTNHESLALNHDSRIENHHAPPANQPRRVEGAGATDFTPGAETSAASSNVSSSAWR